MFDIFDKNKDQIIDAYDLRSIFVELGQTEVSIEDCKMLVDLHDHNDDHKLSFREFVALMIVL